MVNWVAPAPGVTPGAISAYSASDGALLERRIQLTTSGTVDLVASGGGLTRVGLPVAIPPASVYSDARGPFPPYGIHGEATFFMTPEDFDDFSEITQSDGRLVGSGVLTAMMAWAPASAFPGTTAPTPEQIYNAGRATGSISFSRSAAPRPTGSGENFTYAIKGPLQSDLAPNTKYWVTVFPAIAFRAATLLYLPDLTARPLFLIPDEPNYAGRAVSFITARPPAAPVITSPVESIYANPGDTITLEFDPVSGNPDRVTPPGGTVTQPSRYSGIAGVQVQMARVPSSASSQLLWTDLPIADSATEAGRGWYIDAKAPAAYGPGTGARTVWENSSVPIKCGTSVRTANHASLPPGNFLVRVRVFTYGHPYPATHQAVKGALRYSTSPSPVTPYNLSPDESAVVASPWSQSVSISTTVQVPPPIPLSPREGEAVVVGKPTTFRWRYRNTHVNSYVQSKRTVQYRAIEPEDAPGQIPVSRPWVTATTGDGLNHATSHVLDLDADTQYEWRVRVTDSSAVESEWSETARFWAVPAPTSGGSATLPISSLDLATLGNGTHRVFLYRRGGKQRVGEIRNCSLVEWNRLRDDISDARVITTDWDLDEGAMLAHIQTWAYELVIFRDNGASVDRVWEGPVARLTYTKDSVEIYARDMMAYAYRRVIRQKMNDGGGNNTGATVVDRATRVLQNAFAPDDPNVLAYLHPIEDGNPAMQYRSAAEYSRTAFEEVDDMASNAGLDYTVVGRSILLWGTRHPLGRLPEFRDKDLGASPIVSEYGMSLANRYIISDGNGIWGQAEMGPLKETGKDPKYGLVEILSSSWASDEDEDDEEAGADFDYGVITEEQRAKIVASFEEHAEQSIASRYPAPVVVRVPDNTSLNPSTVVSIQHLVPGVAIPLRSTSTLREVSALQKLDSVRVTETDGKEVVAVTMSPFNRRDDEMGEGEEVE